MNTLYAIGDLHLRTKPPACRKDDWIQAVRDKLELIPKDTTLLIPGDVFESWREPYETLSLAFDVLPEKVICVAGQHDLPFHSWENKPRTPLHALERAGRCIVLSSDRSPVVGPFYRVFGASWGQVPPVMTKKLKKEGEGRLDILLWHAFATLDGSAPGPDMKALSADDIREQAKGYDIVLMGDNHAPWESEDHDMLIHNVGSVFRLKSDQKKHRPHFIEILNKGVIMGHPFKIAKDIFLDDEKAEAAEVKGREMETYLRALRKNYRETLSFKEVVEGYLDKNKQEEGVEQLLRKAVE